MSTTWEPGYIEAGEARIHYTRTGGALTPLVLLHGFSDDGLCWSPIAAALAASYDVIMVDARGHGRSSAPAAGYGPAAQAADVAALVRGLDLYQPIVLGHSMGAATALAFAGLYPELPGRVILEDPPTWWAPPADPQAAAERMAGMLAWAESLRQKTRDQLIAEQRAAAPTWPEPELGPWADSKLRLSPNVLSTFGDRSAERVDWPATIAQVRCPALLLTADPALGAVVTPEGAESLRALLPALSVAHIPGAGHSIRREQPAAFLAALRGWLPAPIRPRDLNKNGRLDRYEDPRRPIEDRISDLLGQMTLEEKAGLMFHTIAGVNPDGTLDAPTSGFFRIPIAPLVRDRHLSHFNVHALPAPAVTVAWHNRLQELAESTRLGIPVTISSDPRHSFSNNPLTSLHASSFSQWPEPIGLAAIGDEALVEQFGEIARQEYTAVGIRVALHPMADLATEPRWARINGTFGEDAQLSARLTAAYIRGFQGAQLGPHSVACMTKHFPGGGPQKDGEDPHFSYGREQVYPGGHFDYHLPPFEAAFAAGTAQIMPYYGMPIGTELEEVGFGFSRQVITDMLRGRYGFDGVVCTDWGLISDVRIGDRVMVARAWGVEHLTPEQRMRKAIEAGVDQFGGESCVELVVALVQSGQVGEARIDESARRLLRDKFRLGLFDSPYLDPQAAERVVGSPAFRAAGEQAQRRAITLLKNGQLGDAPALPIRGRPRLYVERLSAELAAQHGELVATPAEADLAILRLSAPYEQRNGEFLEQLFHAGDLDFKQPELDRILAVLRAAPTVVVIELDRPAVIPEIAEGCAALLAEYGASDAAVLDVLFGRHAPEGRLPFELPSSMEAVRRQHPDVPHDSERPLFPFGHGLGY